MQKLASFSCVDWLRRAARAASLVAALSVLGVPGTAVSADVPDSAWFIDGTGAAIQIFDCSGLLCGRIIWLHKAHDAAGQLAHDNKNPDPAFRQRLLCGLTILQGLQPADLDHWSAVGSTTRTTGGVTAFRQNSVRPMCSKPASIWACQDPAAGHPARVGRMVLEPLEAPGLRSGGTAGNQHAPPKGIL